MFFQEKEEKKVEYLELIYDLIFVYIIGRNNSLLQAVEGGFVPAGRIFAYILCTLAIIQIWNFSTFYMNMFGRNSVRDHVFLFIVLMFLFRENMKVNIAISVVFVFAMFLRIYMFRRENQTWAGTEEKDI